MDVVRTITERVAHEGAGQSGTDSSDRDQADTITVVLAQAADLAAARLTP